MHCVLSLVLCLGAMYGVLGSDRSVVDKGDHLLICSQEPIEFGIVLDSSVSIAQEDFKKAKEFLVSFLQQFDIGDGENDVRVSIITFGKGIYPQDAFNLDTYSDKDGVLNAINNIKHRAGPYTDTGLAIRYMHNKQLNSNTVRSNAEKISLVITDGNSQSWSTTKREAAKARADNITMFALGVGSDRDVGEKELIRIAGSEERVTRVNDFDSLDGIKELLAKKTCIRKEKPTTEAPRMIEPCGIINPADIEFIFSPTDLTTDATSWTVEFISNTLDSDDMKIGFRYGVNSGSCPVDSGFNLNTYDNVDAIKERLQRYDGKQLSKLIDPSLFDASRGGRDFAKDIAVLFVNGAKGAKELEAKVQELIDNGIEVYVANPAGYPVTIAGATALSGRSSRQQADHFIERLCPK